MADENPEQRERRLVREAEARARDDARIEAHLARHDEQFRHLTDTQTRAGQERAALKQQVSDLVAAFDRSNTIAETRAEDAEKASKVARRAAEEQVTSRQLYVAAAGVTVAVLTALLGTLAAAGVL